MIERIRRIVGVVGLAYEQVRADRTRTVVAVIAVALAVLSVTLLSSVGYGVVETGRQKFDAAERDLWVTGGPIEIEIDRGTGLRGSVVESHALARDIRGVDGVESAVPLAFQTLYVGTNETNVRTLVGVGVPGRGESVQLQRGPGFRRGDVHYANGSYDGPMTGSVIVDPRTASLFDVEPGDTLLVGGTVEGARSNRYTVVGVSGTFSRFLGAPSVAVHLSELQKLSGTAATDRATFVTVTLRDGADAQSVATTLRQRFPAYEIRTNREQLRAVLRGNAAVMAAGVSLVVIGVGSGIALTTTVLSLLVYDQRRAFAALRALGLSTRTLSGMAATQGLVLATVGGLLGLLATPVAAVALDGLATRVVGFSGLLRTPESVYLLGAAIALAVGCTSALVAGWRMSRTVSVEDLRR